MAAHRRWEIALYRIKEIFYSLQGEGIYSGRAAVFIRFSGCNLWSGLEHDRLSADCAFCDTDFLGMDGELGGKYDAEELAQTALSLWSSDERPFVICTGGEPLLQIDSALLDALHAMGGLVAVETNGTLPALPGIDWITVSPKAGTELRQTSGNELKLVYPQNGIDPSLYEHYPFEHFFLQPVDSPEQPNSLEESVEYCLTHPKWKLSVQMHKAVNIK